MISYEFIQHTSLRCEAQNSLHRPDPTHIVSTKINDTENSVVCYGVYKQLEF